MEHVVNDGAVRMMDAFNSKKFYNIRIKRAVMAVWQNRFVSKIGRPAVIIGEIKIESLSGASQTIKKMPELNNSYNNAQIFNVDESSLRVPDSSNRNVVHPDNAKHDFYKSAARMANSTLIAEVEAVDNHFLQ
ncbi:uncharacterized protein MONOS_15437 [Monocercomonoides exilis]|uniref:uncharacterized protein n=1 Tax=Monocercomonoides exilis TaxID=2049356 RepID=UPI00355A36B5|nr:hypothetical protein MONOS_15437 [Monocercomonoides exilis]|eukprot:MONOS_15437.1-p1 / transcript=MONOS_15437.1 / gene=MONOS_15437 / organism=Monocercomonoides_exilis_PA203 / gene_product=unspecified product / transcript_product=unspecified product / location=Mono_scaffold01232:3106-3744(-) / protein_length=133 / sequence_SO=supercontig / SO=protein_coding / is_pseudo=false